MPTSHLLMIRPVNFAFNAETAVNNLFQVKGQDADVQAKAYFEFDDFVSLLRQHGIDVTVVNDTPDPYTPDSIFPNNWISFHDGGVVCLYPMFAENRRKERKQHVLQAIREKFKVNRLVDLSHYENDQLFLEGTGSMVLDRENRVAYACLSPRTEKAALDAFCTEMQFTAVSFTATDGNGFAIYHTNVMMCIGDNYAVICLDAIPDSAERSAVAESLLKNGKEIIEITAEQMNEFAGNMLQVCNRKGEMFVVMSSRAFQSLSPEQVGQLRSFNQVIHSPLTTIELNGGGSARCMMAEVYLQTNRAD